MPRNNDQTVVTCVCAKDHSLLTLLLLQARYARNFGLAGILVWQIDTDDFQPFCYEEPFHLIRQMRRALELPQGGPDEVVSLKEPWMGAILFFLLTLSPFLHDLFVFVCHLVSRRNVSTDAELQRILAA